MQWKKTLTGSEFKNAVEKNPFWVRDVVDPKGEPITITDYADLECSPIAHLSRLIHFIGADSLGGGSCASFACCTNLETARGTFWGSVSFSRSDIKTIDAENLVIKTPDSNHTTAFFLDCKKLKVATGTFPGTVYFNNSGVTTIRNFKIVWNNPEGDCKMKDIVQASFKNCQIAYAPDEILINPKIVIDPWIRKRLAMESNARELLRKSKSKEIPQF